MNRCKWIINALWQTMPLSCEAFAFVRKTPKPIYIFVWYFELDKHLFTIENKVCHIFFSESQLHGLPQYCDRVWVTDADVTSLLSFLTVVPWGKIII